MPRHRRKRLIETALVLTLLGVLAGALGGLAIGVVTSRSAGSTSSQ